MKMNEVPGYFYWRRKKRGNFRVGRKEFQSVFRRPFSGFLADTIKHHRRYMNNSLKMKPTDGDKVERGCNRMSIIMRSVKSREREREIEKRKQKKEQNVCGPFLCVCVFIEMRLAWVMKLPLRIFLDREGALEEPSVKEVPRWNDANLERSPKKSPQKKKKNHSVLLLLPNV